jgi:hypothetical protein
LECGYKFNAAHAHTHRMNSIIDNMRAPCKWVINLHQLLVCGNAI